MNDQQIEQEIQCQGLSSADVEPVDIEDYIVSEHYFTAADGVDGADIATLRAEHPTEALELVPLAEDPDLSTTSVIGPLSAITFCVLVLKNGAIVTGEWHADPKDFDAESARQIARQFAKQKPWPLMSYELKSKLAQV